MNEANAALRPSPSCCTVVGCQLFFKLFKKTDGNIAKGDVSIISKKVIHQLLRYIEAAVWRDASLLGEKDLLYIAGQPR